MDLDDALHIPREQHAEILARYSESERGNPRLAPSQDSSSCMLLERCKFVTQFFGQAQ